MPPFEIARDPAGVTVASNGEACMRCDESDAQVFRRRAIQKNPGGEMRRIEWVVARAGDIHVYFDGRNVIVSRRDLNP